MAQPSGAPPTADARYSPSSNGTDSKMATTNARRNINASDLLAIADRIDRTLELVRNNGTAQRESQELAVLGVVSAAIRSVVAESDLLP